MRVAERTKNGNIQLSDAFLDVNGMLMLSGTLTTTSATSTKRVVSLYDVKELLFGSKMRVREVLQDSTTLITKHDRG